MMYPSQQMLFTSDKKINVWKLKLHIVMFVCVSCRYVHVCTYIYTERGFLKITVATDSEP